MCRHNYEAIAEIIKGDTLLSPLLFPTTTKTVLKSALVLHLVEYMATDNPQFDEAEFRKVCGPV